MLGTSAWLAFPPRAPLLLAGAGGAYLVYLLERSVLAGPEDAFAHPKRLAWLRRHPGRVATQLVGAAGLCGVTLPWLRLETLWVGALLALIGLLYAVPFRGFRLKAVWWLKPLLIALAWSVGGVVLSVVEAGLPLTAPVALLLSYRALLVLANVLLTDLADVAGDRRARLSTLATRIPAPLLRKAAAGLVLCGGLLLLGSGHLPPSLLVVELLGALCLAGFALRGEADRATFSLTADLLIGWPLLVWLVSLG